MHNKLSLISLVFLLASCAQLPMGPSVAIMPAPGKPFDLFITDESICRRFAEQQTGISAEQASDNSMISGAAAGTAIGAVAGTAIGAMTGHIGEGAIIGAGAGLIEGTAIGASRGYGSSWIIQQRYNIAYEQCMYAKGNQIPGYPVAYAAPLAPPPPPPPLPPNMRTPRY